MSSSVKGLVIKSMNCINCCHALGVKERESISIISPEYCEILIGIKQSHLRLTSHMMSETTNKMRKSWCLAMWGKPQPATHLNGMPQAALLVGSMYGSRPHRASSCKSIGSSLARAKTHFMPSVRPELQPSELCEFVTDMTWRH